MNRTWKKLLFARRTHKCRECGGTINVGEKYSYVTTFRWYTEWDHSKICLECLRDWDRILLIFHGRAEVKDYDFGYLQQAVQAALNKGLLGGEDSGLVEKWLEDKFERFVENLPQEEREKYYRMIKEAPNRIAFTQMRAHSVPFI